MFKFLLFCRVAASFNNSIKDSPQKDVGLDAQKAARPLLLGVTRYETSYHITSNNLSFAVFGRR